MLWFIVADTYNIESSVEIVTPYLVSCIYIWTLFYFLLVCLVFFLNIRNDFISACTFPKSKEMVAIVT